MTKEKTDFLLELEDVRQRLLDLDDSAESGIYGETVSAELYAMAAWIYRLTRDITTRVGDRNEQER